MIIITVMTIMKDEDTDDNDDANFRTTSTARAHVKPVSNGYGGTIIINLND